MNVWQCHPQLASIGGPTRTTSNDGSHLLSRFCLACGLGPSGSACWWESRAACGTARRRPLSHLARSSGAGASSGILRALDRIWEDRMKKWALILGLAGALWMLFVLYSKWLSLGCACLMYVCWAPGTLICPKIPRSRSFATSRSATRRLGLRAAKHTCLNVDRRCVIVPGWTAKPEVDRNKADLALLIPHGPTGLLLYW